MRRGGRLRSRTPSGRPGSAELYDASVHDALIALRRTGQYEDLTGGRSQVESLAQPFEAIRIAVAERVVEDQGVEMGEVWSALVISGAGPNGFCTGNDQSYDPELEKSDYRGEAETRYGLVIQQMS